MEKKAVYLGFKDAMFILDALEYQIKGFRVKLADETIDEDEAADMRNDLIVLEGLVKQFNELRDTNYF